MFVPKNNVSVAVNFSEKRSVLRDKAVENPSRNTTLPS
jgi:hypothetical protein